MLDIICFAYFANIPTTPHLNLAEGCAILYVRLSSIVQKWIKSYDNRYFQTVTLDGSHSVKVKPIELIFYDQP